MKKNFLFALIVFFSLHLNCEKIVFKLSCTGSGYYPEYTNYHYDAPVIGLRLNFELYNLLEKVGMGASGIYQIESLDDRISSSRFYDVYLHNFYNFRKDERYYVSGFYCGIRNTKLEFNHYKTKILTNLEMTRVLLGFKYESESWGFDVSWSQAKNRKPILGYEFKFRNSYGVVFQIGRRNRGPMQGAKSDFYIYSGYEFFL